MSSDRPHRRQALVEQLLREYQPHSSGSAVDSDRIRQVIMADPDGVAEVFPALLKWNIDHDVKIWGLLFVIAKVYEIECHDDGLATTLTNAATTAGVTLPKVLSFTAHDAKPPNQIIDLQMAAADVRAGDAHRLLTTMAVSGMSADVRTRVIGNCILSFPVDGDPRPIQHIPEVRRFVADVHKRMRYFPLYLSFDVKYKMHLVYFGCLADEEATTVTGGAVALNLLHDSFVLRTREALQAIVDACDPLQLDWRTAVRQILSVFDQDTQRNLFGRGWQV